MLAVHAASQSPFEEKLPVGLARQNACFRNLLHLKRAGVGAGVGGRGVGGVVDVADALHIDNVTVTLGNPDAR